MRRTLATEFFFLCLVLPGLIIGFHLAFWMLLFLWGASLYCCIIYQKNYLTSLKELWNAQAITRTRLKHVALRWIGVSAFMYVFLAVYNPDHLFGLVRERPQFIPVLMVFYPIFSALPQEFIYCTYFFRRYDSLFRGRWLILMSAASFSFAHVLFINPVAPVLSFFAGLIFAYEFSKTRSLALVTLEHSLYGISLFLIGLGWYFYGGTVQ